MLKEEEHEWQRSHVVKKKNIKKHQDMVECLG